MANLPINYGDTGKVARDKINDSFDALEATVEGYRPHIEDGIRWIGDTNTGVKAEGDSIVMKVEDGYIWYKSESNSWTKIIAVADLKGPQGNPGADGNGIASIISTKIGKTTTVTITETDGNVDTFQIQDGADGVGGDGDVKGPDSSTNGHMAVFDGATGKIIRDGGSIPTGFEPGSGTAGQILRKTNSGYEWDDESAGGAVTSVNGQTGDVTISVPTKVSDLTNDSGYITDIKTINNNSLEGTGDVTINEVPSGGTEGQVLTKGSSGYSWEDAGGGGGSGDVVVSTDTGNELTTGVGLWLGTETDFSSISTPDTNTLYIQYKSDGGGGGLPAEYQEVERIQSSGTQHIDSGFTPSNTTKVELKMGGWSNVEQYQNLFGTRQNWSANGKGFLLGFTPSNYFAMFGKTYDGGQGWNTSTFDFADGNDYVLEMSQAGIYQDGVQMVTLDSATFTAVASLCIFADNDNGTANQKSSYKLYYFKIWDDSTLVREFVPCYRIADSVIGLYDTVNDQFYTNDGSGTFTKGNDVS